MKGIKAIPSTSDLVSAYNFLSSRPLTSSAFLKYGLWARFDPRLAEILIERILINWKLIDPYLLNKEIRGIENWAPVFGVLLEHASVLVTAKEKQNYNRWRRMALLDIKPANGECFWIGIYSFGGKLIRNLPSQNLRPYERWGYYGKEWLVNKAGSKKPSATLFSKKIRLQKLRQLAEEKLYFTLHDYLVALDYGVQKRTAELDLASAKFLLKRGRTRGRVYRLKGQNPRTTSTVPISSP